MTEFYNIRVRRNLTPTGNTPPALPKRSAFKAKPIFP